MDELKNKVALLTGLANKRSLAFGIGGDLLQRGAELIVAYLPTDRDPHGEKIKKVTDALGDVTLAPLDVRDAASVAAVFKTIKDDWGRLDILVHSIASAKREELSGRFSETSLEGYLLAQEVSAFSLIDLVRGARPLMTNNGGSVITLSYIGSVRAVHNYNVMGAAKAALEANVRYLAMELGPENIRVNAISAGPIRTVSASGIQDFLDLLHNAELHSAMKRSVTVAEIAHAVTFLASDRASGITGQVMYVDAGYNING